jgi:hypothetical protein
MIFHCVEYKDSRYHKRVQIPQTVVIKFHIETSGQLGTTLGDVGDI